MDEFSPMQIFLIQQLKNMEIPMDAAKGLFFGLETETAHKMFLDWMMDNYDQLMSKTINERDDIMTQKVGELIIVGVTTEEELAEWKD